MPYHVSIDSAFHVLGASQGVTVRVVCDMQGADAHCGKRRRPAAAVSGGVWAAGAGHPQLAASHSAQQRAHRPAGVGHQPGRHHGPHRLPARGAHIASHSFLPRWSLPDVPELCLMGTCHLLLLSDNSCIILLLRPWTRTCNDCVRAPLKMMQAPVPEREQPATALNDTVADTRASVSAMRGTPAEQAGSADSAIHSSGTAAASTGAASVASLSTNGKSNGNGAVVVVGPIEGSSSMAGSGARVGSASASNGSLTAGFSNSADTLTIKGASGQRDRGTSPDDVSDSRASADSGMNTLQQGTLAVPTRAYCSCHACLLHERVCLD